MRLIDADRLKRQVEGRSWRAKGKMIELIDDSPTIRVGENTCKHRTAHGLCLLYTDAECTSWCVDGPCSDEEIAEPGFRLDEWCEDCKEYDKERHWCPRFNRVIHEVAKRLEEEKHG